MSSVELGIAVAFIGGIAVFAYVAGRNSRARSATKAASPVPAAIEDAEPAVATESGKTAAAESPHAPEAGDAEELGITRVGAKFDLHAALVKTGNPPSKDE